VQTENGTPQAATKRRQAHRCEAAGGGGAGSSNRFQTAVFGNEGVVYR